MTKLSTLSQTKTESSSLSFEVLLNFFQENNWSFLQYETEPVLRMGYQGENGEWNCIAKTKFWNFDCQR